MMRLSVQLYTLRNPLTEDYRGTLKAVADMGIEYVELAGLCGNTPEAFKEILDELGLKASGAHVGVPALESDLEGAIAEARTIGYKNVIVPWADAAMYADGWDVFGKRLGAIGALLRPSGLTLSYHNHDFEFKGTDGLSQIYANTAPEDLSAEIDCAWVGIGGYGPLEYVKRLGKRVKILHLKNYDPEATPRWVNAGDGEIDFKPIVKWGRENGVQFGVIELDECAGDPIEAVRESAAYLKSLGLR